ncbi:MAG: AMP-binding protein, partial [Mogibacterium sp.]|nr:AMP-binding protein [Mogibacterium sp.]
MAIDDNYNWTVNENEKIVFPIPEGVKTPWFASLGEQPKTLEYFNGTMYEKVEEIAKKHPLNIALDFMGKHISYRHMIDQINLCAKSLRVLGIREDDKVTIAMPNCPQAIYMLYAVNLVGAVANMIHPLSAEKEIENYLNMSNSVMVVTLDQFYHKIEAVRRNTKVQNVIIARIKDELTRPIKVGYMLTEGRKIEKIPSDAPVFQWPDFMGLGKHCGYEYKVKRSAEDPAAILYSGGTTGTTKGIVLTNLNFNALSEQVVAANPMFRPGDK